MNGELNVCLICRSSCLDYSCWGGTITDGAEKFQIDLHLVGILLHLIFLRLLHVTECLGLHAVEVAKINIVEGRDVFCVTLNVLHVVFDDAIFGVLGQTDQFDFFLWNLLFEKKWTKLMI